jgi:ring-1,2-phenylacetyl-CoA epoxidase subunit PaaC
MQALIDYTLCLADDALILGHRNSEWTGFGPILEQDIAISNIALDLIGQARNFYQYAARLMNASGSSGPAIAIGATSPSNGNAATEDQLAYLRDSWDYKNCLLVEQTNGDWAKTILRQFLFSTYQFYLYGQLRHSRDTELAAISDKAYKEVAYHLRWSSEWVIRLGDGTDESHTRMEQALNELWAFTGELFVAPPFFQQLTNEGIAADLSLIHPQWNEKVKEVFAEARLDQSFGKLLGEESKTGDSGKKPWIQSGGREGRHTEHLGLLLAEMQFLQRAYPGCEW